MVRDLATDHRVTVLDRSEDSLRRVERHPGVNARTADLSDLAVIRKAAEESDLIVGALPSHLGYAAIEAIIETATPCCDISFMIEDPRDFSARAVERGVPVIYDCGVAPGLANVLIAHATTQLERVENVVFYVGGLPKRRTWPYEYKAPFAPSDVVEEYTRPARLKVGGKIVVRPALSDPELIDFPEVGTLEAFNTDGLRSLLDTIDCDDMKEKTLRYPGHIELMRVLRETGLFSKETIDVPGGSVRPLDVTSKLLFDHWRLEETEPELTLLVVEVRGEVGGVSRTFRYRLYDEFDPETGEHSMSRTTGFPCTSAARMILDGTFREPGVHPPERLGLERVWVDRMLADLEARGVKVHADES